MSKKVFKSGSGKSGYPSDVSEEEWAFCAPYLTLMKEEAPQREYALRELFNGVRYMVRAGCPWRMIPHDLPPWHAVYEQSQRWIRAGSFEKMAHDLRTLVRLFAGIDANPTAAILDARTMQSTPESGARAGYDGHKKRKGSKIHAAVDTLGIFGPQSDSRQRAGTSPGWRTGRGRPKSDGKQNQDRFCRLGLHRSRPRRSCRRAWRAT